MVKHAQHKTVKVATNIGVVPNHIESNRTLKSDNISSLIMYSSSCKSQYQPVESYTDKPCKPNQKSTKSFCIKQVFERTQRFGVFSRCRSQKQAKNSPKVSPTSRFCQRMEKREISYAPSTLRVKNGSEYKKKSKSLSN